MDNLIHIVGGVRYDTLAEARAEQVALFEGGYGWHNIETYEDPTVDEDRYGDEI